MNTRDLGDDIAGSSRLVAEEVVKQKESMLVAEKGH